MAESPAQPLAVSIQRVFPFIGPQRLGMMLTVATVIACLVAGYLWSQTPDYRLLYANLTDRDGGSVIAALQQMNVPYKFADGGALMVPANQVHEVRLKLAAQGMPKGGNVGFELMETQKFGVSQFAEQVNFQRALEGELARSIEALAAVQNARVHLALTRSTAFMRDQPKPSASVLLNLYPGRTLDASQVSAVVHLVSNSVPDLQAKNVSVVDQSGNLLSAEGNVNARPALDPNQLKYRQELERGYIERIEAIIAPIAGANNVRAQVTAELDFSESEHAEEIYKPNQDPANAVVRSQQTSESSTSSPTAAGGVPGALSNQPPGPAGVALPPALPATPAPAAAPPGPGGAQAAATPAPAAPPVNSRKDATVNYEVDKTIRHTRQEIGRVKRLAVAVVVNHKKLTDAKGQTTTRPLVENEINQITELVKQVMGYSKERGDTVSVMNSAFNPGEKEKFVDTPLWKNPETIETAKMIGKNLLIAGVLLFIVLGVLKPMLKTLAEARPSAALGEGGETQQLLAANYQQRVERAKQLARSDPKAVATVVKDWVSDGK